METNIYFTLIHILLNIYIKSVLVLFLRYKLLGLSPCQNHLLKDYHDNVPESTFAKKKRCQVYHQNIEIFQYLLLIAQKTRKPIHISINQTFLYFQSIFIIF